MSHLVASALDKHGRGALAEAEQLYRSVLETEPDNPVALQGLGVTLRQTGRDSEALEFLRRATAADPHDAGAYDNLAGAQVALGKYAEAAQSYDAAIRLEPADSLLRINHGKALVKIDRHGEAVTAFARALELEPANTEAQLLRIVSELKLQRFSEALKTCTDILRTQPNFAAVLEARGRAFAGLNQHAEACADFKRALALDSSMAEARVSLAVSLFEMGLHHELLSVLDPIFASGGTNATSGAAWNLRGMAHDALGQTREAAEAYERSLQALPDWGDPLMGAIRISLRNADWSKLTAHGTHARRLIDKGEALSPFAIVYSQNDPILQRRCTERYMAHLYPPKTPMWHGGGYGHTRIRLAYASADFHDHPVGRLMNNVIQAHDRNRFELIGVSYGPDDQSALRKKIINGFDQFLNFAGESDENVARWLREREVDILVDLTGYTREGRPGIFAHRPVPIQVNWLGTPGTLGAPYFDYVIADSVLVPPELEESYSEKVVRLPHTFTPGDPSAAQDNDTGARSDEGLPPSGFVFAAFNTPAKITPSVFDVWMRLLARIKGSVLWLRSNQPFVMSNLRREAEARGIDPSRLIFAHARELSKHKARHKLADLFLDTFPYNGGSTTADALSAGLPVLSCLGRTHTSRMSASMLTSVGLSELVARSLEEYESRAVELAASPQDLGRIRAKLQGELSTSPLFNSRSFCRNLEELYSRLVPSPG